MNTVVHNPVDQVKVVSKPWGQEIWLQPTGGNHTYALKEITLNRGHKTSLQVHKYKAETNYILEGHGQMIYYPEKFDCDRYLNNEFSAEELEFIFDNLVTIDYGPGSVMTIEPGTIHRMVAVEQLRFIEASTTELDDVIRLQDDAQRAHGRIEQEHSK
jgi:mannose-6-phosphate isomerase-like protein (cupin superfamily)